MPMLKEDPSGRGLKIANASLSQAIHSLRIAHRDDLADQLQPVAEEIRAALAPPPPPVQPRRPAPRQPPDRRAPATDAAAPHAAATPPR